MTEIRAMNTERLHLHMANFLSVTLLLYYLGGFCIFTLMNSYSRSINMMTDSHLDFSFLDTVSESSKQDCTRINKRYGMSFDCETTPWSQLRVPYDKLYFVEKMDVTLNNFFKSAASLVGRNFSTIDGISVLLVFLLFAPLAALGGRRLLWRLRHGMARGVRSEAPAKPYYKTVLGVFALVMLLLCAGVVISASLNRPGAVREAVPDAQVDVYGDTVRGLLN